MFHVKHTNLQFLQYNAFCSLGELKVDCFALQVTHVLFTMSTVFSNLHDLQYNVFAHWYDCNKVVLRYK